MSQVPVLNITSFAEIQMSSSVLLSVARFWAAKLLFAGRGGRRVDLLCPRVSLIVFQDSTRQNGTHHGWTA